MKNGMKQNLLYFSYLIIFICYLVVCLFVFFYHMERQIHETIQSSLLSTASQQTQNLQTMLDEQFHTLNSLASYISSLEDIDSQDVLVMLNQFSQEGNFKRVQIADPDGNLRRLGEPDVNVSDREYFQRAMAGETVISEPLESRTDNEMRVTLAVPLKDDTGTLRGILMASLAVEDLLMTQSSAIYDATGVSFVCDSDGSLIVRDSQERVQGENIFTYLDGHASDMDTSPEDIKEKFSALEQGSFQISFQDTAYYLTYVPMEINDWLLCYAVPRASVMAEYQFIRSSEITLGSAILGGILILVLLLTRSIRRERRDLMAKAQIDPLTGIKNRSALEAEISMLLSQPSTSVLSHAFVICDIDDFKAVNDTCGHTVGDQVLTEFAALLRRTFRSTDIVGRLGGDEFIVFLCRIPDREAALTIAGKFIQKLKKLQIPGQPDIQLMASLGIAFSPDDGVNFSTLYRHADQALYASKKAGKGRTTIYTEALKDGKRCTTDL